MTPGEAVARLDALDSSPAPEFTSTGSVGLDLALGTGGYPLGRVSEIYGEAFCGKTTIALSAIPAMQKLGTVAYVPLTNDFNPGYARRIGIDVSRLMVVSAPVWGSLWDSCPADFVVLDSLSSQEQSQAILPYLGGRTVLAVSQVRAAIGDTFRSSTGGYARNVSVKVRLSKSGPHVLATIRESPYRPYYHGATFSLNDSGIDHAAEVLDLAVQAGLVATQSGRYTYAGEYLGHGRTAALEALAGRTEALELQLRGASPRN